MPGGNRSQLMKVVKSGGLAMCHCADNPAFSCEIWHPVYVTWLQILQLLKSFIEREVGLLQAQDDTAGCITTPPPPDVSLCQARTRHRRRGRGRRRKRRRRSRRRRRWRGRVGAVRKVCDENPQKQGLVLSGFIHIKFQPEPDEGDIAGRRRGTHRPSLQPM